MKASIQNSNISWIADQMHSRSDIDIQDIILNNDNIMVNYAEVAVTDSGAYNVTIVPWTCNTQEDDFELFGVDGATIQGLDTSSMTPQEAFEAQADYLATMDSATFTSPTGDPVPSQWKGLPVVQEQSLAR